MSKILDLLLRPDTPDVQKNLLRGNYEVLRLSQYYGEPFVIQLKGVPYGRALELKDMPDSEIQTVLAGDADGLWRSSELRASYGPTPAEVVKALLLPGEIRSIAVEVERLSGFRRTVLRPWGKDEDSDTTAAVAEALEKN